MVNRDKQFEAAQRIAHKPMLRGLDRKVAPEHAAIVVIDMQNDFVADGGMMGAEGWNLQFAQEMAKRLPPLLETARSGGVRVIFVRSVYSTEHRHYLSDVWMEQAARSAPVATSRFPAVRPARGGVDYCEPVRLQPGDAVVTKHRYNAFINTDLDTILRANGIRTVVFTGVSTNCCVEHGTRCIHARLLRRSRRRRDGELRGNLSPSGSADYRCTVWRGNDNRRTFRNLD